MREVDSGNSASPVVEEGGSRKVHVTPLPKLKMLAVAATLLTESICTTMLLPFVGLYVAHLQHISVEDAGYYSGILVGLFMLGQVVSAKMWGWLSDVYGRRIPLIVGLFAGAWTMLFFGMAPNIYVCCLMRFIHGFFNGNVLIAKIIIADITDSTNVALGFSLIGFLWGVGAVVGPAIGGFLYDPLHNPSLRWMHVQPDSYLARNPAFLASVVLCLYTLASLAVCVVVLPETNPHRTGSIRTVPVIGWIFNKIRPKAVTIVPVDETAGAAGASPPPVVNMTYMKVLKDIVLRTLIIIVMCICVTDMTYVEIVPLWAISPRDVGGLGFFSDGVGVLMLLYSFPTFVTNLLFAKLARRFNDYAVMWEWSLVALLIATVLTPFAVVFSDRWAFWYVWVMGSLKNCAASCCFTIDQVLVSRAAPPGTLGAVYGITQSFGTLVRCVVPFVVAPLFAWSISGQHSFPFNHYMVFFLCALPLFYGMYLCWKDPIERTPEEIVTMGAAAREKRGEASEEEEQEEEGDALSVADYRSLASSFAISHTNEVFSHLEVMEANHMRHRHQDQAGIRSNSVSAPSALEFAGKAVQQEDSRWGLPLDEEEQPLPHS